VARAEAIRRVAGVDGASLAVASAGQAITLAALVEASDGPLLVIAATQSDAEALRDDLACFLGTPESPRAVGAPTERVVLYGAWDTLPLERVSPEITTMGRRCELRWRLEHSHAPDVIVAPVRALLQRLAPSPAEPIVVRRGAQLDLEALSEALVASGYRREPQVEHRGEFAVRGGIIDIFGSTMEMPVRLDLFGDEVDRLGSFDVADQRTSTELEEAWLFPCREFLPDEAVRRRADVLCSQVPWASSSLRRIAEGDLFDGMEGWLGMLVPDEAVLTDGLDLAGVVLVEPRRIRDRAVDLLSEEEALVATLLETWSEGEVAD
jgi:transcription-repair coupling factor (superfamily II helicase)